MAKKYIKSKIFGYYTIEKADIMIIDTQAEVEAHMHGYEDYISTDDYAEIGRIYYPKTIKRQVDADDVNESVKGRLEELYEKCKDCKFVIFI